MLEDYGDPKLSGIDRDLTPIVGQCLYVIAQWLLLWSSMMGREPGQLFNLEIISTAESELSQVLYGMTVGRREVALRHARDISFRHVSAFMPFTFKSNKDPLDDEEIKERIRDYVATCAPLLDSYGAFDGEFSLPSKVWHHALLALQVGESPKILRPAPRKGRSKHPYSEWSLKYELYLMRKPLRNAGISAHDVNELFRAGAAAEWDTASRWKKSAKDHLPKWSREEVKQAVSSKVEAGYFSDPETGKRTFSELCGRYNAFRRGSD